MKYISQMEKDIPQLKKKYPTLEEEFIIDIYRWIASDKLDDLRDFINWHGTASVKSVVEKDLDDIVRERRDRKLIFRVKIIDTEIPIHHLKDIAIKKIIIEENKRLEDKKDTD